MDILYLLDVRLLVRKCAGYQSYMALQIIEKESIFLPELQSLVDYCEDPWCIGGDFHITRRVQERFSLARVTRGMRRFNNFIAAANLMKIPLSNGRFTWSRKGTTVSHSLLDRFLISSTWDDLFANTRVSRQAGTMSDNFPILLKAGSFD